MFLLLFLSTAAAIDYPTFKEGKANTTINVGAVLSEDKKLRCTVKNDPVSVLKEINIIPAPTNPEDNWELKKSDEEGWAEVIIMKAKDSNKGNRFTCEAENTNQQHSFLTYDITNIYQGITFREGEVNSTIPIRLTLGTAAEIRCTVINADPPVTELTIEPVSINPNYGVIGDGKTWIGIKFKRITDATSTRFVCTVKSDVTVAKLTYNIVLLKGITFAEGPTNGTLNRTMITETTNEITCTVKSSDPPITDLFIEPTPPPGEKDYEIIKDDTSIKVKFLKITHRTPLSFKCAAKNSKTVATLEYWLKVLDPVAPVFTMGGNVTVWNEMATGSNYTLTCTVIKGVAIPEVTMVDANPPSDKNWEIIKKNDFSVEIKIIKADSALNKRDYACYATNGLRSTNLIYQNYVGSPPIALDVTLHSVINKDKIEFSISVTDRNTAPAQNILVYIAGVTSGNVTLQVPLPDSYDDEIEYGFDKFLTMPLPHFKDNLTMNIYASNALKDAYIKDIHVKIPSLASVIKLSSAIKFVEGQNNATLVREVSIGTEFELRCTVAHADPPIINLTITECASSGCRMIGDGKSWIGVHYYSLGSRYIPQYIECSASNAITTATLRYELKVYKGITFVQGNVNSTYNYTDPLVIGTQHTVSCNVSSSDPQLYIVMFQPTTGENSDDYTIFSDPSNNRTLIKFLNINKNMTTRFICYAKNRLTTATLTFVFTVKQPRAPVFIEPAVNNTIVQILIGQTHHLKCVVEHESSLPAISSLTGNPPTDYNWEVTTTYKEIDIRINQAYSVNSRVYGCTASNGVLSTTVNFQVYVGDGPPSPKETKLTCHRSQILRNISLSLDIYDSNWAPIRSIIYNIQGGATKPRNVSIPLTLPYHFYPIPIRYTLSDIVTLPVKSVSKNTTLNIYAINDISKHGPAFIQKMVVLSDECV